MVLPVSLGDGEKMGAPNPVLGRLGDSWIPRGLFSSLWMPRRENFGGMASATQDEGPLSVGQSSGLGKWLACFEQRLGGRLLMGFGFPTMVVTLPAFRTPWFVPSSLMGGMPRGKRVQAQASGHLGLLAGTNSSDCGGLFLSGPGPFLGPRSFWRVG